MVDGDINDDRNIATAQQEWDSGIEFSPTSNTYALVRALTSEYERIDDDLEDIYDSHHIDFAEGDNLDKIGDLIGLNREIGENDATYRARIKAEFGASTVDTTFNDFIEFVSGVLDTSIDNVDLSTNYEALPAVVTIAAQSSVYQSVELDEEQLVDVFGSGVPAGHAVQVIERGTFILKSDGETDDPNLGLTSDSISTGGTLAEDLVT